MLTKLCGRWQSHSQMNTPRPAYLLIADIISDGINSGEFQPRDRLPPLRELATALSINYTTATRGYAEAKRRGLIDSRPGMGSYIRGKVPAYPLSSGSSYEMTMNSPSNLGQNWPALSVMEPSTCLISVISLSCCVIRTLAGRPMKKPWPGSGWKSNCRR